MKRTIILASTSPRRLEMLKKAGLEFEAVAPEYEEDMSLQMPPAELVQHLAQKKAESVAHKYNDALIIGADTVVVVGGKILGKPGTPERAKEMLMQLSGAMNEVITGFSIINTKDQKVVTGVDTSRVYIRTLTGQEIDEYIRTGEPLDKAGAYAIQGGADAFITKVEGDYDSVMGLPVKKVLLALTDFSA